MNKESIDSIERVKAYILEHIKDEISLKQLAQVAGYSMYHTSHIFKEIEGMAPFEYIRKQRLISSAFSLRKNNQKVIDIAFDYMFSSHEGYTRAFSKSFGISPKRFSQTKQSHDWLIPYSAINDSSSKEELNMKDTAIILHRL